MAPAATSLFGRRARAEASSRATETWIQTTAEARAEKGGMAVATRSRTGGVASSCVLDFDPDGGSRELRLAGNRAGRLIFVGSASIVKALGDVCRMREAWCSFHGNNRPDHRCLRRNVRRRRDRP